MQHPWNVSPERARELQRALREALIDAPLPRPLRRVGGVDVSFNRGSERLFAAAVVIDLETLEVVEEAGAEVEAPMPYVPGLLTFREAPAMIAAWQALRERPPVLVCDGHGRAHPQRMGIAAHLGVWLDVPTIGCAKNVLHGRHAPPGPEPGDRTPLLAPRSDELLGYAVRTRRRARPVLVGAGHRATHEEAVELVLRASAGYRLPEPTRQAHEAANALRRAATG